MPGYAERDQEQGAFMRQSVFMKQGKSMWANLPVTSGRKLTSSGCGSEALGHIGKGI